MMSKVYPIIKRLFDFTASMLAIILLFIPWIFISITIKIQSPGPVIYKARRVGQNGKIFILYKFRTMQVNSGKIHATTLRGDSRVYPFGRFLRDSKLDETPQLFNILKGEMSLIGPRPEDEQNANRIYIGKYQKILSVKPGLSSPASLYDYTHGELYESEEEYIKTFEPLKMEMELLYIRNRSIFYDLQIIMRTIMTIILIILRKKEFKDPKELNSIRSESKVGVS